MMRLALFLGLSLGVAACPGAVLAQGCGQNNPNCIVPTAPPGTSNNQAASTEFVQNLFGRTRLTAPLDLWADFAAGNDANTCLTMGSPCKTAQAAYDKIVFAYDTAGQTVTIHLASNDTTCLALNGPWTGGGPITVTGPGNSTTQPTIGFVGCSAYGVLVNTTLPNNLTLANLALSSGGNDFSIRHIGTGQIVMSNVAFGSAGKVHMYVIGTGAQLSCVQPTLVTTTAGIPTGAWAQIVAGGTLFCPNAKFIFLGTQTYAVVAATSSAGIMLLTTTSFCSTYSTTTCPAVTAVSGQRFNGSQNGVIDTGTTNINFIPGSTPGVLTNGGVYN